MTDIEIVVSWPRRANAPGMHAEDWAYHRAAHLLTESLSDGRRYFVCPETADFDGAEYAYRQHLDPGTVRRMEAMDREAVRRDRAKGYFTLIRTGFFALCVHLIPCAEEATAADPWCAVVQQPAPDVVKHATLFGRSRDSVVQIPGVVILPSSRYEEIKGIVFPRTAYR